jgi:hypothetical protein
VGRAPWPAADPLVGPAAEGRPPPEKENHHRHDPAQLSANRVNAQKSTGPRTPEGKARSSQNARKHGFTATSFPVVRLEDIHEIANLRADLLALYQPSNSQQTFALERLAIAQQTLLRSYRLEAGLFTRALGDAMEHSANLPGFTEALAGDMEVTKAQNRNLILAEGFIDMHRWPQNPWTTFLRYQVQAERLYRRALDDFQRTRAEDLPNEPNSDPNPLDSQPLPEPETNPNPSPEPAHRIPHPTPRIPAERSDASPAKMKVLPQNTTHEIWRHRLSRKQLRSRRVLRRLQQPRAESRIHLARLRHARGC